MKKKILFFCTLDLTIESFCKEHILELSKNNLVTVLTKKTKNRKIFNNQNIEEINIDIRRNISFLNDLKLIFILFNFFRKNKFNMIVTLTPKAGFLGSFVALISFIKIRLHIFTGQVWATEKGLFKLFLIFCDKCIIFFSTNILFDSRSQLEFVRNILNIKQNNLFIHNGSINGVDTSRFKRIKKIRSSYRKSYGIKKKDIVFLYVGRLNYQKGVDMLIDNFNTISKKSASKMWLFLVGNDESEIKNNYKHISNVKFHDFTNKLDKFYQIADIFCSFSKREGFGVSIIQASSYSLPIVCSDIYGFKDSVKNNFTGLKFYLKNQRSIIKKLLLIVDNKSLREKLGSNGRKFIQEKFEKKVVIKKYNNYFNRLVNKS